MQQFGVDDGTVRSFVSRFESGDRTDAVRQLLDEADDSRALLHGLFGVGHDGWLALAGDAITGTCLEVAPDGGRQTAVLAGLADEVHALGASELECRLLAARSETDSAAVHPVRADESVLPFAPASFDTIVATGRQGPGSGFDDRIARLYDLLADGGSLVIELDGWPRTTGLTGMVGLEGPASTDGRPSLSGIVRSRPASFVSTLEGAGFDDVELYALLPTGEQFEWALPVGEPDAVEWVLDAVAGESRTARWLRNGASVADRLGVLKGSYPSYLAVCRDRADSDADPEGVRVLRRGANRSIVVELVDGSIDAVRKVPNHPRNGHRNERAHAVRTTLRDADSAASRAIPDAALEGSRLGPVLVEEPVRGTPIRERLEREGTPPDPAAFDRALETGLDWIRDFQASYAGERRRLSPEEVRRELTIEQLDFAPPSIDGPVRVREVPSHGDYHPGNVAVADDGSVECVFDWEYASLRRNPVADPAFYAVKLTEFSFGGFERGVTRGLLEPTPYAERTYERLAAFCEATDVEPRAFGAYVGHSLVTQVATHFETGSPWRYHPTPRDKVAKLEFLYDDVDRIVDRLRTEMDAKTPIAAD